MILVYVFRQIEFSVKHQYYIIMIYLPYINIILYHINAQYANRLEKLSEFYLRKYPNIQNHIIPLLQYDILNSNHLKSGLFTYIKLNTHRVIRLPIPSFQQQ